MSGPGARWSQDQLSEWLRRYRQRTDLQWMPGVSPGPPPGSKIWRFLQRAANHRGRLPVPDGLRLERRHRPRVRGPRPQYSHRPQLEPPLMPPTSEELRIRALLLTAGTRVLSERGPGVVVDDWLDPETMARPARVQPIVRLDSGRTWMARTGQLELAEGQLGMELDG